MSSFMRRSGDLLCLLCYLLLVTQRHRVDADENAIRPYQFSFNIVDFQHRFEKKDTEGIITGEYGFITADGVYHETGYATDKDGKFLITKMRNRKITSLKDAQEIFRDKPEKAKQLFEAVAQACSHCIIQKKDEPKKAQVPMQKKMIPVMKQMMKTLSDSLKHADENTSKENEIRNMVRAAKKLLSRDEVPSDRVLEKMAGDLYYHFNYTITTHNHHENGYRSGNKDGSYRSQNENGIDTQVRYLSNEFGHQPNITFIPQSGPPGEKHALKGYTFRWYWS